MGTIGCAAERDDFDREGAIEAANALGIHGIVFKENGQAIADIEALLKGNLFSISSSKRSICTPLDVCI